MKKTLKRSKALNTAHTRGDGEREGGEATKCETLMLGREALIMFLSMGGAVIIDSRHKIEVRQGWWACPNYSRRRGINISHFGERGTQVQFNYRNPSSLITLFHLLSNSVCLRRRSWVGVSDVCNVAYFEVPASSGEELISTRLGGLLSHALSEHKLGRPRTSTSFNVIKIQHQQS